jgi:hypothetical protein
MTSIFRVILVTSTILSSCRSGSTNKQEEKKSIETTIEPLDASKIKKAYLETENQVISNKVICTEKEAKNEDGVDPILIKTCFYKAYKTITNGYPDYKGRYSYEYSVFKKQENGNYIQIKNASLFNKNKKELLLIINSKIEKDYNSVYNDPETRDCFEDESFTPYNFDQLGITFSDDKINFEVTFGLAGACMSVDGTTVSFSLEEIQKYLID